MADIKPGDLINNKYQIESILGEGGMGTVFRAREIGLDRIVALKVPKPEVVKNKDFMARFGREAKLVAKLNHDNIVQVFEFYSHPDLTFMALEFVRGAELAEIARRPPKDMRVRDILSVLHKSCDGIAYAHEQGIVHRDIKPANILVSQNRDKSFRVKVMDFGIAHVGEGELFTQQLTELTQAGSAMGTPSYMSPEQVEGRRVTPASDIYSMGCVYFFSLTLRNVFEGSLFTIISQHVNSPPPDPSSVNPNLPAELYEVILKALAKDAGDRFKTARDLAHAFDAVMAQHGDKMYRDILPPGAAEESEPLSLVHTPSVARIPGAADALTMGGDTEATLAKPGAAGAGMTYTPPPPTISSAAYAGGYDQTRALGGGATGSMPASTMTGGGSGFADATAFLPEGAAADAFGVPRKSGGGAGKLVAILVVLLAIAGGAFYFFKVQNSAGRKFEQLTQAGNYLGAVDLLGRLEGDERTAADAVLTAELDTRLSQLKFFFQKEDTGKVDGLLPDVLALARALHAAGTDTPALAEAQTLNIASNELKRFQRDYQSYQIRPSISPADMKLLEEQAGRILESVSGLVNEEFQASIEGDLENLRRRVASGTAVEPSPSPKPTPPPTEEAAKVFAKLLGELEEPSIKAASKVRDWTDFVRTYPKFEHIDEAQRYVGRFQREVLLTPEILPMDKTRLRFTMGSSSARDLGGDEEPEHPVELSPFGMAKCEVTAEAFALFLNEAGNPGEVYWMPRPDASTIEERDGKYYPQAGAEQLPANYVTWAGASAYAEWLSRLLSRNFSLPTEAQWERAALGRDGQRNYPWGDDVNANKACYDQILPENPPFFTVFRAVDTMADGRSDEGVHHLGGNAAEWVLDWYDRGYQPGYQKDPTGPAGGLQKVVRGGSWDTRDVNVLRGKARDRKRPDSGHIDVGFRLVENY